MRGFVRAYQYRQGDVEADRVPKWLRHRKDFGMNWSFQRDDGSRHPSYVWVHPGGVPDDTDWILEDVLGKLSRMSDDVFQKLYQPMEDGQ